MGAIALNNMLIKKDQAKIVNLGSKIIRKYTASDRSLEINHMTIKGRHPEIENHFIFETGVSFMVYILKGTGTLYVGDNEYEVGPEDVVYVPKSTKYAVESDNLEYLTVESPAWYSEQAFIVDEHAKIIEETKV